MRSGPPLDCVDLVDLGFSEPELSVDAGAWAEAFSSAPRRVLVEGEVRGYSGSGEGLYFIEDGLVRLLLISRAGTEKTFCILGAGALFGEVNVIDPSPNPWLLNALQTTAVRFLPSDEARRLAREDPRLAMDLMASLARKLRMAGKQINDLSFRPVPSRVACLLLARTARPPSNAAGLTHDEIASFIGSNRETVTRTLRQMRSMGLIRYDRQLQNVVILDRRGLERIAARET